MRICKNCGFVPEKADFLFCPRCGAKLDAAAAPADEALMQKLNAVLQKQDISAVHSGLLALREEYPGSLEVEKQLLLCGDPDAHPKRRNPYRAIRCYLLQMYLEPGEFSAAERDEMRGELFHHPQLMRCLSLCGSDEKESFLREYLEELSLRFADIFMKGNNLYMRSFMGISSLQQPHQLLAPHAARALLNMQQDEALSPEEKQLLMQGFYRGYRRSVDGITAPLDKILTEEGIALPES